MARVIDNLTPGFTRTIVLPVLYAIHHNEHPYTIEKIFNAAMKKNHRELINIVFPENSLQKQGIVYIGEKMGLKGGWSWKRFWRNVGYAVACVVVGAVIGVVGGLAVAGAAALYGASLSLGMCSLLGGIIGAAFGFTIAMIDIQKEAEKVEIEKSIGVCRDVEVKLLFLLQGFWMN